MRSRRDAYKAVMHVYNSSPGKSWARLNSALHDTLIAAITAHLSFSEDDFAAIWADAGGGYWMGRSEGSTCGERYYIHAVKVGHTPACISFERYAERPAVLWAEAVRTPERLRIGSDLIWKGLKLTVTNMRQDDLVACSYGPHTFCADRPIAKGDVHYIGGYRLIEDVTHFKSGAMTLSVSDPSAEYENRKPERVVRISYKELAAARKAADAARKTMLKEIETAKSTFALEDIRDRIKKASASREYRIFDMTDFGNAITARLKQMAEAANA